MAIGPIVSQGIEQACCRLLCCTWGGVMDLICWTSRPELWLKCCPTAPPCYSRSHFITDSYCNMLCWRCGEYHGSEKELTASWRPVSVWLFSPACSHAFHVSNGQDKGWISPRPTAAWLLDYPQAYVPMADDIIRLTSIGSIHCESVLAWAEHTQIIVHEQRSEQVRLY